MNTIIVQQPHPQPRYLSRYQILQVLHPDMIPETFSFLGKEYPVVRITSVDAVVYVKPLLQASVDQIRVAIHVLWERGWKVTSDSVTEMCLFGAHLACDLSAAEKVIAEVVTPGAKEAWLACFNWKSEWAQTHPRPRPIDPDPWRFQEWDDEFLDKRG